ncbi:MAG TPA: glutamate racemase [Candidatus Limnocylindria bacterium]|nr:glutamate racemase [Candidatus Limnocylindria bacterium]
MVSPDHRPIAVFDSGVGGLTVLSEIQRRLPGESTVYLGDNARTPYGPRSADEVRAFTLESADWLLAQDPKVLVLACNTATAHALPQVREHVSVPVLGVVRPGAVAAAAATRSRHVGVVATAGTVASGAYLAAIGDADPAVSVVQQACPDLVPLVEAGDLSGPHVRIVVGGYLDQLRAQDPQQDTLLLGCTHYPLLRATFEQLLGPAVSVVDSAFTTALALEDLLDALQARSGPRAGVPPQPNRVATTGDPETFRAVAVRLFGDGLPDVEAVELVSAKAVRAD